MRYSLNNEEYIKCECSKLLELEVNDNIKINMHILISILNFYFKNEFVG